MPLTKARALRLAFAGERSFIESSFGRALKELSETRLRQQIGRARTLRDKYRDLAKRQPLVMRGKRQPSGRRPARRNENTAAKAGMFAEVLERLRRAMTERRQAGRAGTSPSSRSRRKAKGAKSAARGDRSTTKLGRSAPRRGRRLATEAAGPRKPGESAMRGARQRRWDEG